MSKAPKAPRKSKFQKTKPRRGKPKQQPKISRGPYGLTVPEAGAMIGLGRNASYEAAKEGGIIPVLEVGSLKIVPRLEWLKKIGATDAA
jgi:hypothetical protein